MTQSLRYGLRLMRKGPGFTAIAVATLALGIGANTAIFSVLRATLLSGLPLRDPGRLFLIYGSDETKGVVGFPVSNACYELLRDRSRTLAGVTGYAGDGYFTLTGVDNPERLTAARVTPNFFDVLGVQPFLGRSFLPEEGKPGGDNAVIISHALWQRRFSADPAVTGKPISLGQRVYSIVGVMPADYAFPFPGIDLWATKLVEYPGLQPDQIRQGAGFVRVIARLQPNISGKQAAAEAAVLFQQYRQEHPSNTDGGAGGHLDLTPLQESIVSDIRPTLLIMTGAVGLVLLIACANVASLMLARATGRAREIAVRAAIGATRGDLISQLLAESVLLSGAGAVMGALLAQWGVSLLENAGGTGLPAFRPVRVDLPVLGFTLVIAVLTGVAFGLIPALQASRPDLSVVLRDSGGGATGGRSRNRARGILVAGQIALSIVLLIGAGLLIESLRQLLAQNPGFDPHHALSLSVNLPGSSYPDDARRSQFVRDVLGRIEALPGVQSASASLGMPLSVGVMAPILAEGQPAGSIGQRQVAVWYGVTPDYFRTLGIPLVRGRAFTWSDDAKAPKAIIVSESTARRYWPNENAIGKHVTYARREVVAEVVGVAGDVKTRSLEADAGLAFYTPYQQFAWPGITFTIRTAGDPKQLANAARAQIFAVDRNQAVTGVRTLEEFLSSALSDRRQTLYLIGGFAAVALLLALIGLYGVMSFTVAQRAGEIGIRQAIGAQRGDILRLVLGQGLRLTAAGIVIGGLAALWLTRFLARMLFHVSATDPVIYVAIALLFLVTALAASLLPAWRATRIDPLEALRGR